MGAYTAQKWGGARKTDCRPLRGYLVGKTEQSLTKSKTVIKDCSKRENAADGGNVHQGGATLTAVSHSMDFLWRWGSRVGLVMLSVVIPWHISAEKGLPC